MLFGKLPNNFESTAPIQRLRAVCDAADYLPALMLHIRFGMACGRAEESDGVLPRAVVLGMHEGSRRVASRLLGRLAEAGVWEDMGKMVRDRTWTERYLTHEQIRERRKQKAEAERRRRKASVSVSPNDTQRGGAMSSDDTTPPPSDDTFYGPEFNDYNHLHKNVDCPRARPDIDLQTVHTSVAGAQRPAAASQPSTKNVILKQSESIPCPRPTSAAEDLQRWLASNGLGVQMTGVQTAMVAKLGPTSPAEREAALALARQWAERKGCEVTAGRVLRCLTDYRAEYEAEMRRPRQVGLPSARAIPRGSSSPLGRIAEAGILGGQLLQAQLAAKHNKS